MHAMSYSGGCLCGAVRYEARGEVTNLCFCHCASCRRATGAPVVPWGTFAAPNVSIVRGRLAEYCSSPKVTRGFCAQCGTSLIYRHDDRSGEIDVTLSSLDDAGALAIADGRAQFAQSLVKQTEPGAF